MKHTRTGVFWSTPTSQNYLANTTLGVPDMLQTTSCANFLQRFRPLFVPFLPFPCTNLILEGKVPKSFRCHVRAMQVPMAGAVLEMVFRNVHSLTGGIPEPFTFGT